MSFRERFKNKTGSLSKQHLAQTKNKDEKGKLPSVIVVDKLPTGVEVWRPKEGTHMMDILPFAAGPDFPTNTGVIIEEGELAYVLDIKVHQNIGSMKEPFVCPWENFKLPCPICDYIRNNDVDSEDWKKIAAKRRVFYEIWLHDSRETQMKGIQLLEMAHFSMEMNLSEIASLPMGGGAINFADMDSGKTVAFTRKGTGAKNTSYIGHRFVDRAIKIPDKLLDKTFPLDSVLKMHPTFEEIEEAFKGQKLGISSSEDVQNAGSTFGGSTSNEVPDWMSSEEPEIPSAPISEAPKRKVFLRKKK